MRAVVLLPLLVACAKGGVTDSAALGAGACPDAGAPVGAEEGYAAPDFALLDAADQPVRLSDHCGEVVLLAFGAFW